MSNLPAAYFNVVMMLNPMSNTDRLEVKSQVGITLYEIFELYVPDYEAVMQYVELYVDGDHIPQEQWKYVKPKNGTTVVVRIFPKAEALVLGLANLLGSSGSFLLAAGGGLSLAGTLLSSAIGIGISLLVSMLFAPSKPDTAIDEDPVYSISGQRNSIRPFDSIPQILGTHKFVPPYGSSPYTEVVGDDQYLRILCIWGYGYVDVNDVKIGNTLLDANPVHNPGVVVNPTGEFVDVEAEHDLAGDFTSMTLFPNAVAQEDLNVEVPDVVFNNDPYAARTTLIDCTEVGVTITFPGGLYQLNSKGERQELVAEHYIVLKNSVGGTVGSITATISGKTGEVKRFAHRFTNLPKGEYTVEVGRNVIQSESDTKFVDRSTWTALRAFDTTGPVINLEGVAKSVYRIRASDQLNGVIDQLNAVVSTRVPTWDGAAWTSGSTVSSNPAAIYRYVLTGATNPKAISSANVDNDALGEWYEFCETNGYSFNAPITTIRSVRNLLQDIASAGKASPAYIDDKWSVVVDKPKTSIIQHFTPRNTWGFNSEIVYPEYPQALRIPFNNELEDYEEDEIIVYDTGYNETNTTEFEVIRLPGQTNPVAVYKLAKHYLAAARLRPEVFKFNVDIENLVASRGDLVRLTHDVALIGQTSGRIKSVDSSVLLTLDEEVVIESGVSYGIRVRFSDGTSAGAEVVTSTPGTYNTIEVSYTTGMAAGDLFMFGETGKESKELIIQGIEYNDDLSASVTCVPYELGVYSVGNIPAYTPTVSKPVSASFVGPATPKVLNIRTDEAALARTSRNVVQPGIVFNIEPGDGQYVANGRLRPTAYYQVRYKNSNSDDTVWVYDSEVSSSTKTYRISNVEVGEQYDIHVRAVDNELGGTSYWNKNNSIVVEGGSTPPGPVETFRTSSVGDSTYLEWEDPDQDIDVLYYEVRYYPTIDYQDWDTMLPVATQIPYDSRSYTVPSRAGTYAIKAVDFGALKSTSAVFANATCTCRQNLTGGLNNLFSTSEEPDWDGTRTNVVITGTSIILDDSTYMSDWTTLDTVETLEGETYAASGSYLFGETDLGAVYTSTLFADADLSINARFGFMSGWTNLADLNDMSGGATSDSVSTAILVSYSTEDDASPSEGSFTEYRNFVAADVTARHLKFKLELSSADGYTSPSVNNLSVYGTAPTRSVSGEDVSSGVGVKSLTFSPAFFSLEGISIGAQDMVSGDYYTITSKTREGFSVEFKNSSGTTVDRTFDYTAVGYGLENGT